MAKRKSRPRREKVYLTKEDFLGSDLREKEVHIEALDRWVWVREMSAAQVQADGQFVIKNNGKPDYSKAVQIPTRIACRQIIDEPDGKRMFTDKDIATLQQKSGAAITQIANAVREFSGQKKDDGDDAVSEWLGENCPEIPAEYQEESPVDDAEANFTETTSDDSPSD